ncbi:acylphosphatase [Halopseudomonas laoshanensis]|uniref:Acylphosphatase n=2 Tax=Halopseudomonas TaxID=2901189 RepID=A0A7V7KY75_9GAMM|nr:MULTISPECIES: acylphosphatase [Halopseudomonas]MBQ0743749.1 acylphosphatase [Pseudomonas sp.]WOD10316.1 acylphosphatase [Pseudomonas sp. NyZ704]KAA0695894.1 acylphosphatase [Halopseudomonas laoshanensis]MBQ0776525.1 acylphosphatase [Pseudomonas sp.]PCC99917.1 acylphosphatase [Halopseudomonas pelagia]|tara:strand:- start:1379 stop:1651 length:273 start_codon:yes stop_codon:yes gene_type:complete
MSSLSLQGYVRGQVQGVGFRQATVRQANKLGISGWVRNLPDGSVEVMLCGEEPALEAMTAWLRTGPDAASVDAVELTGCAWQEIAGFVQL